MRTLKEWNDERMIAHQAREDAMAPHPNRIACPTCAAELWDSNPTIVLDSWPAQMNVHCPACGYRGFRIR